MKKLQHVFTVLLATTFFFGQFGFAFANDKDQASVGTNEIDVYYLVTDRKKERINRLESHFRSLANTLDANVVPDLKHAIHDTIKFHHVINVLEKIQTQNNRGPEDSKYEIVVLDIAFPDLFNSQIDPLHQNIQKIVKQGTTVIVPAGRHGRQIKTDTKPIVPASFSETLTAGTARYVDSAHRLNRFAGGNFGPQLDVVNLLKSDDPAEKNAAAINTSRDVYSFYMSAMSTYNGHHRPSPRMVKWEMKKQGDKIEIVIPQENNKVLKVSESLPTVQFKGKHRVPDDYSIISE